VAIVSPDPGAGTGQRPAREAVSALGAPAAVGPYSQAVRLGDFVWLSGQAPLEPVSGELVEGDAAAQVRQVFANLSAVLTAANLSFDDVAKVNVYLIDLADFASMNQVYAETFTEPYPARTTVAVAGLPMGARVEIDLVARA
jgi:2-iminobutanoate/2-iminopropanoate deaminase